MYPINKSVYGSYIRRSASQDLSRSSKNTLVAKNAGQGGGGVVLAPHPAPPKIHASK